MEISRIVESSWKVLPNPRWPEAQAFLDGLLGSALQEGMEKSAPEYVKQLKLAVELAPQARSPQQHLQLLNRALSQRRSEEPAKSTQTSPTQRSTPKANQR